MKITIIAGARPNFMKIAPIIHAIQKVKNNGSKMSYRLIHTGQHYDKRMSDTFFEELNIPQPDSNLECGGGTQAEQTAAIMIAFEKELLDNPSDLVLVVGDVTSTMACSIVAKKLQIKVAHVEAGIRSNDRAMPEEINRLVTDSITDYYFTTSEIANQNLRNEGVAEEKIFFVGNVMIDTLLKNQERFAKPSFFVEKGLQKNNYIVLTMHRPANVDQADNLISLMDEIIANSQSLPIIFPIHPRTAKIFNDLDIAAPNLHIVEPLGYLEFNYLVQNAKAVITDSGGITEETTVMGVPCITLRDNTERPETVNVGTNELIGTNPKMIEPTLEKLFRNDWKKGGIPEKWDGKAASRIVATLLNINSKNREF
ncbi:non-hydrolyzing UDP-N-acetylglucosamine 2-epimerase [Pontibacter sp. H249]|uniref:non-hydrolyzing UDP-N-acetylglucosamine 2-epimerase n=1 Tax=Pontibacter sp. H249 TaxID=3133420 RepID=UPI0030C1D10F